MNQFSWLAKTLIFLGLGLITLGVLMFLLSKVKGIGQLPGDIYIQKKNFTFYFPLASSLIISLVISFLLWVFSRK